MSGQVAELNAHLQQLSGEYTKLQEDLSTSVQARQKLEAQKQENASVQKEFGSLKNGETIYKLIGPVLIKQERDEAESTVQGRLDFIGKELTRIDSEIKGTQEKMDKKKGEIIQAQTAAQAAAPKG